MSIPDFSEPFWMRATLQRIVQYAGRGSNERLPRWSHVGRLTSHGSGYSQEICTEFGVDPHELVGGLQDEVYCNACGYCQGCLHHHYEEHDDDCEALLREEDQ